MSIESEIVKKVFLRRLWLFGLAGLLGLAGCSDDGADDGADDGGQRITFEAMPCATGFEEPVAYTRAWPSPEYGYTDGSNHYVAFDDSVFAQQKNLVNKSIGVFFTKDAAFTDDGKNSQQAKFYYSDAKWRLNMEIKSAGDYFLYGYIPDEDVTSASITANNQFSQGAVLTLQGVKALTPGDLCVIVGAKEGIGVETVSGLNTGKFTVNAKQATGSENSENHNYIFLLFDHLYAALRFRFTVDATYDQLRTIKLRRLEMVGYGDGTDALKSRYNITITLKANDTYTSPIESVTYTPVDASPALELEPIFAGEATLKHDASTDFMGCFVPTGIKSVRLRSTYDVYDKNGNLIRQNCQAENAISLESLFGTSTPMQRGHRRSVTLKVDPTYLYMLSEPDLDNPTVKVAN